MAPRRFLGCLPAAALALCVWTGCKDKGDASKAPTLDQRCEQLAKACGDQDKHVEKLVDECKQAAAKHEEKGCADKASAAYECYTTQLCGRGDKVWAMDDFRVLADRNKTCVSERNALRECIAK